MTHRWTEEDIQQVKAKRVMGGSGKVATSMPADLLRKSIPSPKKPQYRSKLELAWATRLEVMRRSGEIDGWIYEPFTFRLAEGNRYRVDFIAWKWVEGEGVDGAPIGRYVTTAYECKGWHRNMRAALIALKWSAQKFPFLAWKKVVRNGKSGFEVYDVVV